MFDGKTDLVSISIKIRRTRRSFLENHRIERKKRGYTN